jgi:hypothetical protein
MPEFRRLNKDDVFPDDIGHLIEVLAHLIGFCRRIGSLAQPLCQRLYYRDARLFALGVNFG